MIRGFEPRIYQQTIAATAARENTLAVLPTGLGKTLIAVMLADHRLKHYPGTKILVLAPTRPLCNQHVKSMRDGLDIMPDKVVVFTGDVKPEARAELWKDATVIVSTPQSLENDILTHRVTLEKVSLLVVDEAHRAVGEYGYVFIADQYRKRAEHERILALTASPGSAREDIELVLRNLGIGAIEVRSLDDPDVKQHVQELDVEWVLVHPHPDLVRASDFLKRAYVRCTRELEALGVRVPQGRAAVVRLQAEIHTRIAKGERDFNLLRAVSLMAQATKIAHAVELAETQGVATLAAYLNRLFEASASSRVKALQNLVQDADVKAARFIVGELVSREEEHPKLAETVRIAKREAARDTAMKMIVFNQYRDQASAVVKALEAAGLSAWLFVGQMKKGETGMTQKEQASVLDLFRSGLFNILVATSVAEEGLDIPAVDLVLFYEPVPSAIRTVQRRGRTGRQERGRVIVLVTKGTRDEAYRWSAHHKEARMYRELKDIRKTHVSGASEREERTLESYQGADGLVIYADHREKSSKMLKLLADEGFRIDLTTMEIGDYLLGEEVCVEFKTVKDFVDSILDGRMLSQARALRTYRMPLIIIEGEEDLYAQRNVQPKAIQGMLATLALSFQIPVLRTKGPMETASLFGVIARKQQEGGKTAFSMHAGKPASLRETQEYIVSSLPGVGPTLAPALLEHFGSARAVMDASEDALRGVELIGEKKAKKIREALDSEYRRKL